MSWRKKDGGSASAIISELVGSVVVVGFGFLAAIAGDKVRRKIASVRIFERGDILGLGGSWEGRGVVVTNVLWNYLSAIVFV